MLASTLLLAALFAPIARADSGLLLVVRATDERGHELGNGRLLLSGVLRSGQEVWRGVIAPRRARDGAVFYVLQTDLPEVAELAGIGLRLEVPGYVSSDFTASVSGSAGSYRLAPATAAISMRGASAWLTLLLILPAVMGLPIAVLRLHGPERFAPALSFAYGGAVVWGFVSAALTFAFVFHNQSAIPIYWPALFVPSGVIVASFLGSFAYAAFSVFEKDETFLEPPSSGSLTHSALRRRSLRVLGGRIWVAPYLSLAVWLALSSASTTLASDTWSLLIGFLSGLYIKVTLSFLNALGTRLLSREEAERLAARVQAGTLEVLAPEQRVGVSMPRGPSSEFLAAVARAQRDLIQRPNVVAVGFGKKIADGSELATESIIAYVLKKDTAVSGSDVVPKVFDGFQTDVQLLPGADPTQSCYSIGLLIDPDKVHQEMLARSNAAPASPAVFQAAGTEVLVLAGQDFVVEEGGVTVIDVKGCFLQVASKLPAGTNFVSFVLDEDSGVPSLGPYAVNVHTPAKGIQYPFADRDFGSESLFACQILPARSSSIRTVLHEIGHTWCAYLNLRECALLRVRDGDSGPQGLYHWGRFFDSGASPMDYDEEQWIADPDRQGKFKSVGVTSGKWAYCETDLYLMGLAGRPQNALRVLEQDGPMGFARPGFTIAPAELPDRIPMTTASPETPMTFRQVYVVLTKAAGSGERLAQRDINGFRTRVATAFFEATGKRARLHTSISLPT